MALEEGQEIWDVVEEDGIPYFVLFLPDGTRLFTRQMKLPPPPGATLALARSEMKWGPHNRRNFPIQFPREVLGSKDILNLPDKASPPPLSLRWPIGKALARGQIGGWGLGGEVVAVMDWPIGGGLAGLYAEQGGGDG